MTSSLDIFIGVFLAISMWIIMAVGWYLYGRDRAHGAVVNVYEPPDGLRPAEVTALLSHDLDRHAIAGTLMDLCVRGVIAIEEGPPGSRTLGTRLRRIEPMSEALHDPDLREYEKTLLARLFASGPEVAVGDLREKFYVHAEAMRSALMHALAEKGYFSASPWKVRLRWMTHGTAGALILLAAVLAVTGRFDFHDVIGAVALAGVLSLFIIPSVVGKNVGIPFYVMTALAVFMGFYLGAADAVFFGPWGAETTLALLPIWLFGYHMPQWTTRGHRAAARAMGYRRYLTSVEKHRTEWAEKENVFSSELAYAIAFGIGGKWSRILGEIEVRPRKN